ncbi:MAG: hypothetical protein II187_01280 [Treponema sp.]|nr:hypothetical protein [Treponema sp.]
MKLRKLIAAAVLALLTAPLITAQAQTYSSLFAQAQAYEDAGQYIHAMGSYWDAMLASPAQAQTALTAYNRLSALIQGGKPGQDKDYDAFDLYDGWTALYRDYQQYWQEQCPFGFTIGTPQQAGLDMGSRTATYRVGAWSWESSRYRHIRDIVAEGYGKSRSSGWSGIPAGWTDIDSADYAIQFSITDKKGSPLLTGERKAVGDYANFDFKNVNRTVMKALDAGGTKIQPSGVWLKSGRSWNAKDILFSTEGGESPDKDAVAAAAVYAPASGTAAAVAAGSTLNADAAAWKASAEQYKQEAAAWRASAEKAQAEAQASKAAETRAIKEAAAWKTAAESAQEEAQKSKAAEAQAKNDAAAWKAAAEQSMADVRTRAAAEAQAKKEAASWQTAAQQAQANTKTSSDAQRTADIERFAACAALAAAATEDEQLAYYEFDNDTALKTGRMYSALLVGSAPVDPARLKATGMDIHELCNFASIRDGMPAAYIKDAGGAWKESSSDSYRFCTLPAKGGPSTEDSALKDIFVHAPNTIPEAVRTALSSGKESAYVLVRSGSDANQKAAEIIAEARSNKKPETLQEGIDKVKVYKDKGVNKVKDLFGKNKDKEESGSK